jgi:hypothetical protein
MTSKVFEMGSKKLLHRVQVLYDDTMSADVFMVNIVRALGRMKNSGWKVPIDWTCLDYVRVWILRGVQFSYTINH